MRGISNRIAAPQLHKEAQRPNVGLPYLRSFNPPTFSNEQIPAYQLLIQLPTNTLKSLVKEVTDFVPHPTPASTVTSGYWRSLWNKWRHKTG